MMLDCAQALFSYGRRSDRRNTVFDPSSILSRQWRRIGSEPVSWDKERARVSRISGVKLSLAKFVQMKRQDRVSVCRRAAIYQLLARKCLWELICLTFTLFLFLMFLLALPRPWPEMGPDVNDELIESVHVERRHEREREFFSRSCCSSQ